MNVYWSQKDIPGLKGLSRKGREAAKRAVIGRVWKHWQVWLPFAILIAAYIVFLAFAPRFPYRFPLVLVTILVAARLAALPFNHYLNFYLSRNDPKS
jgi:MFS superfamily sulfate permease-like transporter